MSEKLDRTGEARTNNFGSKMIILNYIRCDNIDVYFPEYDWVFEHTTYNNFKRRSLKCPYERRTCGVGYLGEGDAPVKINKKWSNVYILWHGMMMRCYDKNYQIKQYTYKDCSVCEEWHNYQNFYKWYKDNYYEFQNERIAVDKDILCKSNKIYSPDNCVFVPQSINNLFVKREASRGEYPIGVSYHKTSNKFRASCNNVDKKSIILGDFDNPVDAFNEYKRFKELTIKKKADLCKDLIPKKLYDAMYRYEVEITD